MARNEAHSVDRALFGGRQAVSPDENGGSVILLNEAEHITISADDEGVSIEVAPAPEPENGNGVDRSSSAAGCMRHSRASRCPGCAIEPQP